jgi:hypothetical protein
LQHKPPAKNAEAIMGQQAQYMKDARVPVDPLAEDVVMQGVRELRESLIRSNERVQLLERENIFLECEIATCRAQLEAERVERDYYQRFAVEITTSLNLVAQVCDDAMTKAQHEAFRKNGARPRQDVPDMKIPKFLRNDPNG